MAFNKFRTRGPSVFRLGPVGGRGPVPGGLLHVVLSRRRPVTSVVHRFLLFLYTPWRVVTHDTWCRVQARAGVQVSSDRPAQAGRKSRIGCAEVRRSPKAPHSAGRGFLRSGFRNGLEGLDSRGLFDFATRGIPPDVEHAELKPLPQHDLLPSRHCSPAEVIRPMSGSPARPRFEPFFPPCFKRFPYEVFWTDPRSPACSDPRSCFLKFPPATGCFSVLR